MNTWPKPFGTVVGIVAAYFVSEGIYQMMLIGSCSTPAGPGEVECPPEAIRYFFYIFFGILGAMAGIFVGGGWFSFGAIFAGVGLGGVRAGLADGGEGWFVWFGLMFLATPAFMLLSLPFVGWKRMKAARLLSEGVPGTATILALEDTGITINGNPRVRVTVRIEPKDGVMPPFESTKTATVSRVNLPRVGDRYDVWFDGDDRNDWMFVYGDRAGAAQPGLRKLVELAREGGRPAVPAPQPQAVVGELNRLNELRLTGKISAEEFAAKTAELLRHTP